MLSLSDSNQADSYWSSKLNIQIYIDGFLTLIEMVSEIDASEIQLTPSMLRNVS